jgi:hypothetical protein
MGTLSVGVSYHQLVNFYNHLEWLTLGDSEFVLVFARALHLVRCW